MKKLVFLLIVIHCILSFSPKFTSGVYAMVDAGVVLVLAGCFLFNSIRTPYASRIFPYFIGFFLLLLLYYIIGYSSSTIGRACFPLPKFLFSVFITMYCCENMNVKEMKGIVAAIVIIAFVNVLYNAIFCTQYPYASTEAVTDFDFRSLNVGGTKFSHFSLSFFILSFCGVLEAKHRLLRIVFLLLTLLSAYYVIQCGQRMTIILFLFMVTILLVISKITTRRIMVLVLTIIATVVVLGHSDFVLEKMYSLTDSERVMQRLNSLSETSIYGVDNDSFSGRIYYYKMSLETLFGGLGNFFFGVGYHEAELENKFLIGIGGHSQILDILAMYGIVGGVLVYMILRYTYNYLSYLINNEHYRRQFSIIFIIFISLSLLKYTFDDHNSLLLFFALPLLYKIFDNPQLKPSK